MDGSIDFMCFPCFDSPSIFAAMLDRRKGGSFKLSPALDHVKHKQLYLPDSNILLTRFLSNDGVAEISDFMPVDEPGRTRLVRRVKAARGELRFRMVCDPRFDYGRAGHRIEKKKNQAIFISRGEDETAIRLRSEVPLRFANGQAMAEFRLREGECAAFVLEDASQRSESRAAARDYVSESFQANAEFLAAMGAAIEISRALA